MTIVAVLCAMFAPILRKTDPQKLALFGIVMAAQVMLTLGIVVFQVRRRQQMLRTSGKKIGNCFFGRQRTNKRWPLIRAIATMMMMVVTQVILAACIVFSTDLPYFLLCINALQVAPSLARNITSYMWRIYPGAIEVFETGLAISIGSTGICEWERMSIRQSQIFDDQLAVVVDNSTFMIAADKRIRDYVMDRVSLDFPRTDGI